MSEPETTAWDRECVKCGHKWQHDGSIECPRCERPETTAWNLSETGEEPTPLMRDLRAMTGFDHVGRAAHDAVEHIGSYRAAIEKMLAAEQVPGGDGWWDGWEMLLKVYHAR